MRQKRFFRRKKEDAVYWLIRHFGLEAEPVQSVHHNRRVIGVRYIKGAGIEIGALGRPMRLSPDVAVKYVDRLPGDGLAFQYEGEVRSFVSPDIVDDAQTLSSIPNETQDFVIANHVVEHLENPILFFENTARVLKESGILFLAIPDKDFTFDRDRPITSFDHLVSDYTNGSHLSRDGHFREFVRLADLGIGRQSWSTEEEFEDQVQQLKSKDYSIHFHVWDRMAMMEMAIRIRLQCGIPLKVDCVVPTLDETVLVFRKKSDDYKI